MPKNKTWRDSVLQVLEEAGEPLHYKDIYERIVDGQIRKITGNTPVNTVQSNLCLLDKEGSVAAEGRGMYTLTANLTQGTPVDSEENAAEDSKKAFASYGLFWKRDGNDWTGGGKLWGRAKDNENSDRLVDFSDQIGIYGTNTVRSITWAKRTTRQKLPAYLAV